MENYLLENNFNEKEIVNTIKDLDEKIKIKIIWVVNPSVLNLAKK